MKFLILFAFVLFFQSISALQILSSLLSLLNLKVKESDTNDWEDGVQKCYDGCKEVFERYPVEIYDIGENLMESFRSYIDMSKMWNESNSTIMSTRSTDLLEAISLLSELGTSSSYSLSVHANANTRLFLAYRRIVRNLSKYINQLVQPIVAALRDLERSFDDIFRRFELRNHTESSEEINFKEILKSGRHLANTINLIVETAHNDAGYETITNETFEAIAVLVCILFDNFLNIEGAIISMAAVLDSESNSISDFHHSSLLCLDAFIRGIAGSMNSLTVEIEVGIRDLLTSMFDQTSLLNISLDSLLGPFEGITITVEDVLENLLKSTN